MTSSDNTLYQCQLFLEMDRAVIDEILSYAVTATYPAGTTLIQKDEIPKALFIIRSGTVGIYSEDVLLAELGPLAIMGESFLASSTATATTTARTTISTVEFLPEQFFDIAHKYPQIAFNIFSITMNRLRHSNDAAMKEAHSREALLQQQVEERTRELNQTLDELRITQQFKDQFLANMSHEIRTPINTVLGMTNLTLDTPLNAKQEKYLKAIQRSSENLLVIINDILDLSKLEAGKMELETIPFQLEAQLEQVYDTLRFKAEEKGLHFNYKIEDGVPGALKGDPSRLIQILINLCGNAIKFTDKGRVDIIVTNEDQASNTLRFTVKDTGIGIPADKVELLFNAFQQVDASTSRKYGGTGLGLSISKTLVELQGGSMQVTSKDGEGSAFSFTIPYTIPTAAEMESVVKEKVLDFSALKGLRVLIAEDNMFNQIVIQDTLEGAVEGIHIDMAETGLEVLDFLSKNDYNMILMDNQMPEMDGMEACRKIRTTFPAPKCDIPILALTASVLQSDIRQCIDAGMNAVIPKPFELEKLLKTLSRFYQYTGDDKPVEAMQEATDTAEHTTDFSMDFLIQFCEGDMERVKKYAGLFEKATVNNINHLKTAQQENNLEKLGLTVHSMKGHLKLMGMDNTLEMAENIERALRNNTPDATLQQLVAAYIHTCELALNELVIQKENLQ